MIVVRIREGLGNQMFQYALGRNIAIRNGTLLKLDISSYAENRQREYRLHNFNIVEDYAERKEIYAPPRIYRPGAYLKYRMSRKYPWYMQKLVMQKNFCYDTDILKVKDNSYLKGWWQSEEYFREIKELIRAEFTFKNQPSGINREVLERIDSVNSVSLHVRRGDYTSHNTLFVLSPDYYTSAVDFMVSKIKKPEIFMFSDDIGWCRENLRFSLPLHFMEHNGRENDHEDLRLMSRCKHHIIANSTFSWWGAWLGGNPGKTVVAPGKWNNRTETDTKDIIPKEWITI